VRTNHNGIKGRVTNVQGNGHRVAPMDITALLVEHKGFIYTIAREYSRFGMPIEDLMQQGCMGLVKAAARFDPGRGAPFLNYASYWIRTTIATAANDAWPIRISRWILHVRARVYRESTRFQQQHGRSPSMEEIAEALGLSIVNVTSAMKPLPQMISLDAPIDGEDGDTFGDIIADTSAPSIVESLMARDTQQRLLEILWSLPHRWREILFLRFGFTDGILHSDAEIAQRLGVSKQRINRIEHQALALLRSQYYEALGALQ
jgi:RNA polymerase primary sigma factor